MQIFNVFFNLKSFRSSVQIGLFCDNRRTYIKKKKNQICLFCDNRRTYIKKEKN